MPNVTYIPVDGEAVTLNVPVGANLMQAAVSNGIYAIVGDCGGSASCATCHVYVQPEYLALVPAASDRETEMLGCVSAERKPNSRLSCQIVMTENLAGIQLGIPVTQW